MAIEVCLRNYETSYKNTAYKFGAGEPKNLVCRSFLVSQAYIVGPMTMIAFLDICAVYYLSLTLQLASRLHFNARMHIEEA